MRKRRETVRVESISKPAARPGRSVWRRLRQRIKALWRWVVVRAVRSWFGSRVDRVEPGTQTGEVRQFPQGR